LNFAKPGSPGAKFKGPFEKMMKALTLPKPVKDDLGIQDEAIGDAFILENKSVVAEESSESSKKDNEDGDEDASPKKSQEEER
jgi:hypothetical protein